jgi:bifunctional UDP-N-acetylglucosamine pyrophosphorylase/glucosamine-1-phosphate N-acetyltransferase
MSSDTPKVLHHLGGRPILAWSLDSARQALQSDPLIVIGPELTGEELLQDETWVVQQDRLGTGHAVQQAMPRLGSETELVLVLNADLPLMRPETLRKVQAAQEQNTGPITLLSARSAHARGFGRILRGQEGRITGILEEAHAGPEELALQELNVGLYCFQREWLEEQLPNLPLSPKGEHYLTDLVAMAVGQGMTVEAVELEDLDESIGINTRAHLAEAERALRARINRKWMHAGVTILDPATTYIHANVELGRDTIVLPNTTLTGSTQVGSNCSIGPNTAVHASRIGDRCRVQFSVIEEAELEEDVSVGPFAHIRKGSHLGQGVHMGNFGEIKASRLGPGVKMGHFSYIGDATIEQEVNIGAGTITCNYDGVQKHPTEIGASAFIGSDTMLVAPVRIGRGARTGAGAVVTKDVPDGSVAVGVPARVIRKVNDRD